jgi:glycosyltransferase involved in cell wall biosynthesis
MRLFDITVVIPAYNVGLYLDDCLTSVFIAANDFKGTIQVVLVNDGSTDSTLKKANSYDRKLNLQIISIENSGLSIARNTGAEVATGKYLIYLDSDDIVSEAYFNILHSRMEDGDLDMAMFGAKEFYDNKDLYKKGRSYARIDPCVGSIHTGCEVFSKQVDTKKYISSACLYIVKTEISSLHQFVPDLKFEDNVYTTLLLMDERLKRVAVYSDILYFRRIRDGSIVNSAANLSSYRNYLKVFNILNSTTYWNENKYYRVFCRNILALSCKELNMIDGSWYRVVLEKSKVVMALVKNPSFFSLRVVSAIFLGRFYNRFVEYYKGVLIGK